MASVCEDSGGITATCHVCGAANEWDRAADLAHRCAGCEAVWDQDANAARNLLAMAQVMDSALGAARESDDVSPTGDATTQARKKGRFVRRREDRSQKQAEDVEE